MNVRALAVIAAIIIVIAVVLFFVHVLSFDGSLLLSIGVYLTAQLLKEAFSAGPG